jgi:hypothetical protein
MAFSATTTTTTRTTTTGPILATATATSIVAMQSEYNYYQTVYVVSVAGGTGIGCSVLFYVVTWLLKKPFVRRLIACLRRANNEQASGNVIFKYPQKSCFNCFIYSHILNLKTYNRSHNPFSLNYNRNNPSNCMRTFNQLTSVDPSNIQNGFKPTALACNDNTLQNETGSADACSNEKLGHETVEIRTQKVDKNIDPNNILQHKRNQQTSSQTRPWK